MHMKLRFFLELFFISVFISIFLPCAYADDSIQDSCGIIQTYFEKGPPHGTNGFVVQKDNMIYFLTVLHVSQSHGQVNELQFIEIRLPKLIPNFFRKKPSAADFLEGDRIKSKRPYGNLAETVDVLAIDVTDELKELAGAEVVNRIIPFETIAGMDKKGVIDKIFDRPIEIACYPSTGTGQFIQTSEYLRTQITRGSIADGYGVISTIKEGEYPSGFWMDVKTEHGDCGRPVIMRQDSSYMIIGLIKTAVEGAPLTFAVDGTAIARTLEMKN